MKHNIKSKIMLIDKYLINYQYSEKHRIEVASSLDGARSVFNCLTVEDISYKICSMGVKGIKLRKNDLFIYFMKTRFIPLEDTQSEIVVGLIGKFWINKVIRVCENVFNDYTQKGYSKLVWSISFRELDIDRTLIETETRIQCDDIKAKIIFSLYWLTIKPFSGLTRRYLLWRLKQKINEKVSI